MKLVANSGIQQASLEVTIRRANGRVEKLGVVDYYDKNLLKVLAYRVGKIARLIRRKLWTR